MIFFWLALFIVLLGIEFATMALTTIWFAGGAVVAFVVALLNGSITLQIVCFIAISFLLLIFTRPFLIKYVNDKTVSTNVTSLIGQCAVVTAPIDNLQASGAVEINGVEWTARSSDNDISIPEKTVVVIREIRGVKLIVEPKNEYVKEDYV